MICYSERKMKMKYEVNMTVDVNDEDRNIKLAIESALDEYGMFANVKNIRKILEEDD